MKKFLFLGLIIITSLFLSKTTFATSVSGVNMNGSSGKLEILNNSKNDSAGDFSLSVSLDFDPDSTESTQFKLPQGADNQIVVKLLGSTGKSLVSSKVISVANLKPTSAPIFSAIYPKSDFLKAFPDPSSPENNAFVQIEDFTNKKIYYKSDVFRVFQYNNQNNGGSSILKPSVTTNSASTITQTNAVLNGEITNTGGANANVRGFSYGTTASYGKNSQKNGSFAAGKFSETISGLTCNTMYHFRALATNSSGTSNGNDVSFTTKACEGSSNNDQQGTTKDFYTFKVKFLPNGVVIDSSQKNALNPGGPDSTLKLCQDHIAKYSDTKKYTILQNCTKTSLLENDNQKYYFTWQEKQDGYKIERENIGKTACETERTSGEYPITTPCSTTSNQSNIDAFNKALGSKGETTEPQDPPKEFDSEYKLLAPIGNLTSIGGNSENKIGDYLNVVLMIAIGLCGALAVIMIVIRGVQYMGDESVFGKTEAKHHIMQAVLGLILALGAYAILNTINPKLVGGTLSFNQVNIELTSGNEYRLASTQSSDQQFKRTTYYDQVKKYVASADYSKFYSKKINHCMAQVAIQRETHGDPNLIGHDEDAPVNGVPSRKRFIESGKKDSGASFSGTITDRSLFNDDHEGSAIHTFPNKNSANYDLGLDWRFSHGIGLMQVTFFPAGSNDGPNYNLGMKTLVTQTPMKMKDLLVPENAIKAGVEHLQYNFKDCNGDVERAYRAYGGGRCDSGGFMNSEAPLRKKLYDQCVAQDK